MWSAPLYSIHLNPEALSLGGDTNSDKSVPTPALINMSLAAVNSDKSVPKYFHYLNTVTENGTFQKLCQFSTLRYSHLTHVLKHQ